MVRRVLFGLASGGVLLTALTFSGCTTLLGDFEVAQQTPEAGPSGAAEGAACTAGTECASGSCADGVCCESACDGVCEACNLPGTAGKCTPVPDGQNPANECPSEPLPVEDAGVVEIGGDDAGNAGDAGDAGSADPDAGAGDAGLPFNLPDGGITAEQNQCAGSCNGKRACAYPGKERTCGTVTCGNTEEQGRASCDGKGRCLFGVEKCEAYACPDGSNGCKTVCTGESDCLGTHFCDAVSGTCKPKLQNGSACGSVAQCGSGFCVTGVCCNDSCTGFGQCNTPGKVGQCICPECASGGTCQLYYKDTDGDGYGDKDGTLANMNAKPGCVTGPAPAGYVANNLDCFDTLSAVRPNQLNFFATPYGPGNSFDYDCSSTISIETPEFVGGTCKYCKSDFITRFCNESTNKCSAGANAGLGCTDCVGKGCTVAGCVTDTRPGYNVAVPCGSSGTRIDCGTCNATSNGTIGTTTATVQQRCR